MAESYSRGPTLSTTLVNVEAQLRRPHEIMYLLLNTYACTFLFVTVYPLSTY
jgi:hypothetical protein